MATYKKGFKKQNAETVLLKVIMGIILSVFALVAVAFIYNAATQWKSYDNYTLITEYDGIFEYDNGGEEALQDYVVYLYSDTCENCTNIKNDVLRIGNSLNRDEEFFFLANVDTMTDADANLAAFLETIDLTSLGTPMIIIIANGEFNAVYDGSTDVVNILETIQDGDYAALND